MPLHCILLHFEQPLFLLFQVLYCILRLLAGHRRPHLLRMRVHHPFRVLLEPLALQNLKGSFALVVNAGGLVCFLDQVLLLLLEELLISDLFLLVEALAVLIPHLLLEVLVLQLYLLVIYFHAHVFDFEVFNLGLLLRLYYLLFSCLQLLASFNLVSQL